MGTPSIELKSGSGAPRSHFFVHFFQKFGRVVHGRPRRRNSAERWEAGRSLIVFVAPVWNAVIELPSFMGLAEMLEYRCFSHSLPTRLNTWQSGQGVVLAVV